jgi:hypothetical protein
MRDISWWARKVVHSFGFFCFWWLGLYVIAFLLEFFIRLACNIKSSDLNYQSYSTPQPDPSLNFFAVFDCDFKNRKYRPRPIGNVPSKTPNALLWPIDPVFSHTFEINSSASDIRETMRKIGTDEDSQLLALRRNILSSEDPWKICKLSIDLYRPSLEKIYSALQKPFTIYPPPYPSTTHPTHSNISIIDLITFTRLMALDAYLDSHYSEKTFSANPVLASLRIAEGIFNRPIGVSHMGAVGCTSLTLPVIWNSIEKNSHKELDYKMILQGLSNLRPMNSFRNVFRQACSYTYELLDSAPSPKQTILNILAKPLIKIWQSIYISYLHKLNITLSEPSVFKKEPTLPYSGSWNPVICLYPNKLFSFYNNTRWLEIMIDMSCLDVALTIFKNEKGFVPDTLDLLTPSLLTSLPLDPFTQGNFRYKKTGRNSYLLYSVWIDGKDDGGTPLMIPDSRHEDFQDFLFYEAKGDLVWPQHHAGKN